MKAVLAVNIAAKAITCAVHCQKDITFSFKIGCVVQMAKRSKENWLVTFLKSKFSFVNNCLYVYSIHTAPRF